MKEEYEVFELDPIVEADRAARIKYEKNHFKKREINGYDYDENKMDDLSLWADQFKFHTNQDREVQRDIIFGEYDKGVP